MYRIAYTGHRPDKFDNDYEGKSRLVKQLKLKIRNLTVDKFLIDDVEFIVGMALGLDTWAAEVAVDLGIPFTAAIPFVGQEKRWPYESQKRYNFLINHRLCTPVIVCPGGYSPDKMQIRNMWMVDKGNELTAVWDGSAGGTKNCVDYARSVHKFITRINPNSLR